jgi:protein gp37
MSDNTGISWTDATWNPVIGCSRVSEGCRNCYAEKQAARIVRMGSASRSPYTEVVKTVGGEARWTGEVRTQAHKLADPLGWRKPKRIFVNSMSDLFHEKLTNEQIAAVFGVMAACPKHTFQVLTKRAKRMREWFAWIAEQECDPHTECHAAALALDVDDTIHTKSNNADARPWPLPNVWLGVSVENQAAADERIPDLLATPAAVRFLSCEPLLGPVDLSRWLKPCQCGGMFSRSHNPRRGCPRHNALAREHQLHWVIAGCESGPGARPCDVAWLRSLRDQCAAAGVAFFAKQAEVQSLDRTVQIDGVWVDPVGVGPDSKRKPGGVIELPCLDGVQHAAFPAVAP